MSRPFALRLPHNKIIRRPRRLIGTKIRPTQLFLLVCVFLSQLAIAGTSDVFLSDATTQSAIPNAKVTAYELSSGSLTWRASGTTNSSGRVILNIKGLGTGKKFILRVNPFGTGQTQSNPFSHTGRLNYRVGSIHAKIIQGSNGKILSHHRVTLHEIVSGNRQWRGSGITDANGLIRFSPTGINNRNLKFQLSAISPYDSRNKRSQIISNSGIHKFRVGNALLKVRLTNKHNGKVVANKKVVVYKRVNSTLESVDSKITNAQGLTDFDLPGLGSGTTYVLRADPYGVGWTYSSNITTTGFFNFKVGALQIKVLKGLDGSVLKNYPVVLYEKNSTTSRKWRASGITDSNGLVWFDPGPLKSGAALYLSAVNPYDGVRKFSGNMNNAGRYSFKVGNRLLKVYLRNRYSKAPLSNISVFVYKKLSSGALDHVTKKATNSNGVVNFDLEGLGSGIPYVLKANPYGIGFTQTPNINQTGQYNFNVGALQFTLFKGSDNTILKNYATSLYQGSYANKIRVASGLTDSNGKIWFDPPSAIAGKPLFLTAKNPFDGKLKFSRIVNSPGQHKFTVGNKLLKVTLKNALTGNIIQNKDVIAYEVKSDGSLKWHTKKTANAQGQTSFDLPGLGTGTNYVIKSNPLNGGWLQSNILTAPVSYTLYAGKVRIKLRRKSDGAALAGRKIILFEKAADGSRHWQTAASTDSNGLVYFDPTGLNQNRVYIAYSRNIFGKDNRYYSPWIITKGHVDFVVDPKGNASPDFKSPEIQIHSPVAGAKVSDAGFILRGTAIDDDKVTKVTVRVKDPSVGTSSGLATIKHGYWSYPVSANMIDPGHWVRIDVTAFDPSQNAAKKSLSLNVISDVISPSLQVLSHISGETVSSSGFLLRGIAKDNTGISTLSAVIKDTNAGTTKHRPTIDIAQKSGRWALAVDNTSSGSTINISITAKDAAGNTETQSLSLHSRPATEDATHLISRTTFGATPSLLAQVRRQGSDAFIYQQLHPGTQESRALTNAINAIGPLDSKQKLQNYILAHAIYSKWQLREVMTWFWDNHFSTDITQGSNINYELSENKKFRQHALGRFRDLLSASASSPAMLKFLDNHSSHYREPNENYARELMELHTMGVNGGYTENDVAEVARVFTGWRVINGKFQFYSRYHDQGSKIVLGQTIPANSGVNGGRKVLDILAEHPATARFICTKILRLLVSDKPTYSSITQCASNYARFYHDSDQISRMLSAILKSNDFKAAGHFHQKVKTPIEFVAGMVRNLDATIDLRSNSNALTDMGMRILHFPTPDGWPEIGTPWINTNQIRQRLKFSTEIVFNPNRTNRTFLSDPVQFFRNRGYETAEGAIGYLFELGLASDYTKLEWNEALSILTDNGRIPFDINSTTADTQIRQLMALVLAYPSYQLQ